MDDMKKDDVVDTKTSADNTPREQKSDEMTSGRKKRAFADRPYLRALCAGLSLAAISAICMVLVLKTEALTRDLISYNQNEAKIARLSEELIPSALLNGTSVKCHLFDDERIGSDMRIYTFTHKREVRAYLMTYSTSRGYSTPLVLIGAFDKDRKLIKNDVLISNETPGLGDKVERRNGNFMDMFNGKGPDDASWDVKKFGGDFDYITGSTVTSRAVVMATKDALDTLKTLDPSQLKECRGSQK